MTDNNVINFPRIGFNLNPTNTAATTVIEPPNTRQPAPTPTPEPGPRTGRRSPLDTLAALPSPGVREPVIPAPTTPAPAPGMVPAAFRSDNGDPHGDLIGPRLGALSLAAILAVAVAALRGAHTVTSTWWENRLAKQAETDKLREARLKHQLAMQNIGDKAAQQRAKQRVPSSSEFGRKSLGRHGNGSGSGSGKGGKSNSGTSTGPNRHNKGPRGPKNSSPNSKTNSGSLRKNPGGNGGKNDRTRTPKPPRDRRSPNSPKTPMRDRLKTPKIRNPKNRTHKNNGPGATLTKTGPNTAERRLKNRRKNPSTPALWRNSDHRKPPKTKTPKHPKTPNTKGPDRKGTMLPDKIRKNRLKKASGWTGGWWTTSKRRPKNHDTDTTRPRANKRPKSRNTRQEKTQRGSSWKDRWNKARAYARTKTARSNRPTTPGPGPGTAGPTPGNAGSTHTPNGARRSPFENAGQAAAQTEGVTYTVVSEHIPGSSRRRPRPPAAAVTTGTAALDPAPTPHTTRPGTSRPKEPTPMPPTPARPDPRIIRARQQAAHTATHAVNRHMDAQHATEITLDDACDAADKLASDAFKAHDESKRLAKKARDLRDTWLQFADDLATNHNLIGPLFTAAAISFAESMDLVARMADEMETASLNAAEKAETAGNELNDAYRPYSTATADAGLTTPSAPIHNHA